VEKSEPKTFNGTLIKHVSIKKNIIILINNFWNSNWKSEAQWSSKGQIGVNSKLEK